MATLANEAIKHIQDHLGIYQYKSYFTLLPFLEQAFSSEGNDEIKSCPNCQNFYGIACIEGSGVEKDTAKGIFLLEAAARQGYAKAQYNLAYYYENGIGVEMDIRKAYELYKAASAQDESALKALPRITRKYQSYLDLSATEEKLS